MCAKFKLACVLFDLDGTLVDTAPDLVACLNRAIGKHGYPEFSVEQIRPYISYGAAAMVDKAAGNAGEELKQQMLADMLNDYQHNLAKHSRFFSGIPDTLNFIEHLGLKWGVVTNKRERFTLPLMAALNLTERAACIVSGDTTSKSKPDPEPMLHACKLTHADPQRCLYVGDARRDIEAGKNANMHTIVAAYGYLAEHDVPESWLADAIIHHPSELTKWL